MYFKNIIGQDKIKKDIDEMCNKMYVPHCQLFIDRNGYGGLGLALYFCLQLIYGKKHLKEVFSKGNDIKKVLQNPDLKFIYPIYSNKNKLSIDFINEWLSFIEKNIYGSYGDWLKEIGDENKEAIIGVNEIENLQNQINLKSFFGGNKVILIWGLEKMNLSASNKILKLLEEPPKKTFFIMITEDSLKLLPTIYSRCQTIDLKPVENSYIKDFLIKNNIQNINYNKTLGSIRVINKRLKNDSFSEYELLIIELLRLSFSSNQKKENTVQLYDWINKASLLGNEKIKDFLYYSIEFLRSAFFANYNLETISSFKSSTDFKIKNLSPYINIKNYKKFVYLFEKSQNYIEQNANKKMLLTEIALKTKKLLVISKN
tara:strand:- start:228 stop:1343 length:1116 start_codon:yes stop_codon:yes gene_type:complete